MDRVFICSMLRVTSLYVSPTTRDAGLNSGRASARGASVEASEKISGPTDRQNSSHPDEDIATQGVRALRKSLGGANE
jgi:hypothetical protein